MNADANRFCHWKDERGRENAVALAQNKGCQIHTEVRALDRGFPMWA